MAGMERASKGPKGVACAQAHLCEFRKNFLGSGRRLISKYTFLSRSLSFCNGHTDREESENEKRRKNQELHNVFA